MDGESFEDNVEAEYLGARSTTAAGTDAADDTGLEFDVEYRPRNRVITIVFVEPLMPYSTVEVTLGDGILATDGASLVPYTLIFSTGGS
jgi:hypothetical protein